MAFASRLLASVAAAALAAAVVPAAAQEFRTVAIPALPQGAVCADDKTQMIERAAAANAAAAENVQTASRLLAERQAALGRRAESDPRIDELRAERDRRTDEWRRAEAVFDASVRLEERPCQQTAQAAPTPAAPDRIEPLRPAPETLAAPPAASPAPAAPPAAAAPVTPPPAATATPGAPPSAAGSPPVSLALAIQAPERCRAGQNCAISIEIRNSGGVTIGSPLLASVALGFDGGVTQGITPETWTCGRSGESLSCASGGLTVAPGEATRFTVDWRLPDRLRRPSATVCARIVWAGRRDGSVYRAEQVAAVQYALTRAGFDTGGTSGRIGPRTLEAIGQFRARAGIPGPNQIMPDLLSNLFGANGDLLGDDEAANDTACTSVAFTDQGGGPVASAPATAEPAARAPAAPQVRESAPAETAPPPAARRPERAQPAPQPERRTVRRPPVVEDDDDDVVVYRTPRRGPVEVYPEPVYPRSRGTVVYGPNGPMVVYPAPRAVAPSPWGTGPRVYFERW